MDFQEKQKRNENNGVGKVHPKPLFLGYSLTRLWVPPCAANTFLFDGKLSYFGTFSTKLGSGKQQQTHSFVSDLCHIQETEALLYRDVFLAVQKSNFYIFFF